MAKKDRVLSRAAREEMILSIKEAIEWIDRGVADPSSKLQALMAAGSEKLKLKEMLLDYQADSEEDDRVLESLERLKRENETLKHQLETYRAAYGNI